MRTHVLSGRALTDVGKVGHEGDMLRYFGLTRFFLVFGLMGSLCAQTPQQATVIRDITLTVGSQQLSLAAGTKVQVLSQRGDKSVISFTESDGSPVITEVASAAINLQTASALPQSPPATPVPNVPSVVAATRPAPKTMPLVAGWQKLKFPELAAPNVTPSWITYDSKPDEEVFHVYVPKGFDPQKTYGFLGWIDASNKGIPPKQFEALYDQFGLIVVGVEKAGNDIDLHHRIDLLVSSLLEISKWVKIDPDKRLITGYSGGARASCIAAFCYPDLFSGVVPWCGSDFYKDFDDLAKPGTVIWGYPTEFKVEIPPTSDVDSVRDHIRFALLTGSKDFNRSLDQSTAAAMKKEQFQVTVIEQPGLNHRVGNAEIMKQGLEFVLGLDNTSKVNP
jgi:dienelactone hydrolase